MSERKVLNKYYPPDFDPNNIPKLRQEKNRQWNIRIMAPFNMRCSTCGEYIYKGKKFNSRKEDVEDDDYLGLKIFRFYIRCPRCVAEISFKTDPQNTDYSLEAGATRNFEALKTAENMARKELQEKEAEEKNNPMKVLENRTKASLHEMEMLETLEDLRQLNARQASLDHEAIITQHTEHQHKLQATYEQKLAELQEEEDDKFVESLFGGDGESGIKRVVDEESTEWEPPLKKECPVNATDILTEKSEESKPIRFGAGGNSINKSTKSRYGLLVKKKSPVENPRPVVTATIESKNEDCKMTKTVDTVSEQSHKSKPGDNGIGSDQNSASGPSKTDTRSTAMSGLSLLGGYSDSDDSSDN